MPYVLITRQEKGNRLAVTTPAGGATIVQNDLVNTFHNRVMRTVDPRRRKPKGFKMPTEYHCYGSSHEAGIARMYVSGKSKSGHVYMYTGADSQNSAENIAVSFDASVENKAILQARSKLKGQKVNFGVAIAESKQTASLIASTATRISKAISAAKKGNLRGISQALGITRPPTAKAKKLARAAKGDYRKYKAQFAMGDVRDYNPGDRSNAHNLFLEHQFGWVPLLSDVKGAAETVAGLHVDKASGGRTNNGAPYTYYVTGSSSSKVTLSPVEGQSLAFGAFEAASTTRRKHTFAAHVRLDCYLDNPGLHAVAMTGLANPATIAWEKVPFSFVADWFLPIGPYFDSLDATLGWKFRAGSISKKMTGVMTIMFRTRPSWPTYWEYLTVSGHGKATFFNMHRTVYTSFPLPSILHPKNPFSGNKVAKAIALVAQQFGKGSSRSA